MFGKGGKKKSGDKRRHGKSKTIRSEARQPLVNNDSDATDHSQPESMSVIPPDESPPLKRSRMTMKERKESGLMVIKQEWCRIYAAVAYEKRFNRPDEDDWPTFATTIAGETGMNSESVKCVWRRCRDGKEEPHKQEDGAGRSRKLPKDNKGLVAGAIALNNGASPNLATLICNEANKDSGVTICRNTFVDTLSAYTDVEVAATQRRKTGKKDKSSPWAKARFAITEQMQEQVKLGEAIEKGEKALADCSADNPPPVWKDGILFVDENHAQQQIGGAGHSSSFSRLQYRVAMDPNTGTLASESSGGRMPSRRSRVIPKFPQEARGAYGCATPTVNGERQPVFMETFDYTGKKLLSKKDWNKAVKKELRHRKKAKRGAWVQYKSEDNPYLSRFGTDWEKRINNTPGSKCNKYASASHLVNHIISEGKRIFGTTNRANTWMIYHDALAILWEANTVEYLKSLKCPIVGNPNRTWFDRFIKICGKYNDQVDARYRNCLPGDSPELMPLDCHLFADIKEGVARNIALSFWMEKDDPMKYDASTPQKLFQSIQRTIAAGCPSKRRILEDCDRIFDETLERIQEKDGVYIEDNSKRIRPIRHGVRAAAMREAEEEDRHRNRLALKADPDVLQAWNQRMADLASGKQKVPVLFDLTGDNAVTVVDCEIISVDVEDDLQEEENDDSDEEN